MAVKNFVLKEEAVVAYIELVDSADIGVKSLARAGIPDSVSVVNLSLR